MSLRVRVLRRAIVIGMRGGLIAGRGIGVVIAVTSWLRGMWKGQVGNLQVLDCRSTRLRGGQVRVPTVPRISLGHPRSAGLSNVRGGVPASRVRCLRRIA